MHGQKAIDCFGSGYQIKVYRFGRRCHSYCLSLLSNCEEERPLANLLDSLVAMNWEGFQKETEGYFSHQIN